MTSSITDVVLSPTVISVYFQTAENKKQGTSNNLSKFVSGEAMASSASSWLHYCYLAKMIACFSFKIVLKCVYDHCSSLLLRWATHE